MNAACACGSDFGCGGRTDSRRNPSAAVRRADLADRPLMQGYAELCLDAVLEVAASPAHNAVAVRVRQAPMAASHTCGRHSDGTTYRSRNATYRSSTEPAPESSRLSASPCTQTQVAEVKISVAEPEPVEPKLFGT